MVCVTQLYRLSRVDKVFVWFSCVAGLCQSPGPSKSRRISTPPHPRAGFCSTHLSDFTDFCLEADQNLFRKVLHNPEHVLHHLGYSRQFQRIPTVIPSGHTPSPNTELPDRLSRLVDGNFITCVLFYRSYWQLTLMCFLLFTRHSCFLLLMWFLCNVWVGLLLFML